MLSKPAIRRVMRLRLKAQGARVRSRRSAKIWRTLKRLKEFRQAGCVMVYWATDEEVQTQAIVEEALALGKRVIVPVTDVKQRQLIPCELTNPHEDLKPGPYGILEPQLERRRSVPMREIEAVVVPGLAFDRQGYRLGRGGGYFDRFLARLPNQVPKIGLAFRFQVVDRLPHHAHDIRVTRLITD